MSDLAGCQHVRQSLGVYVLGAIDPAERSEVDAHLAGCPACREDLAGLAGLPALLGRVPFGEAERIAGFDIERPARGQPAASGTPGDTLSPLLARIAHRRRVSRWRGLAAAAAVVLAAAAAATGITRAAAPGPVSGPPASWQVVRGSDQVTHAAAEVAYNSMSWGTALDARVSGIAAGTTCQFWVVGAHGQRWQAGSWTVGWQSSWFPGSSSVPAGAVRSFEITSGHRVLVSVPA